MSARKQKKKTFTYICCSNQSLVKQCSLLWALSLTRLRAMFQGTYEVGTGIRCLKWSAILKEVVGWGTMLQAGRSLFRDPMRPLHFFNLLNPSSRTMALGITQRRNEYQKQEKRCFWVVERGRRLRLTTWPPCVSWLRDVGSLTSHNSLGLHVMLRE
jgi:hypothetical protein